MKNSLDRLITAKDWISVLKDRTKEMIQNAAQKDKGRENVSEIKLRNKE